MNMIFVFDSVFWNNKFKTNGTEKETAIMQALHYFYFYIVVKFNLSILVQLFQLVNSLALNLAFISWNYSAFMFWIA